MDDNRRPRPPPRDFTTSDIEAPSPTYSSSSGVSQKPDFRTRDDFLSDLGTYTTENYNIGFRTDWLGSRASTPIECIQCPVCMERMATPKMLPCLHNICKKCLQQHILTFLREVIQADVTPTSFPCPVCARHTKPPEKHIGCEKWATLFPTNYFLQAYGMIMAVQREEVGCEPCLRRGESTLATWWCRECSEYQCNVCKTVHGGFKIFKHHDVISVKVIAENPDIAVPTFEPCTVHKEKVTHFCRDHRISCCGNCMVTTHRKCEHVPTVTEEFNALNGKGGFEHITGKLSEYEDSVNDLIDSRRGIVEDVKDAKLSSIKLKQSERHWKKISEGLKKNC